MSETTIRTGTVLLKIACSPDRWQRFGVKEDEGLISYYLGDIARTSDGWVTLAAEHHDRITWDQDSGK